MSDESGSGEGQKTERTYTDADLNRILAEERRKSQKELAKTQDAFKTMQAQVEQLLQGRPLDDVRAEMEANADKLRSAEEQAALAEKKFNNRLTEAQKRAEEATTKYRESVISRSLIDAALPKATGMPAAKALFNFLRENAKLGDDDSVSVEMEVVEDGVKVKKALSPVDAIAALESIGGDYAPYFKSHVAGGVGGQGSAKPASALDISSMSMDEYMKRRQSDSNFLDNFKQHSIGAVPQ